MGQIASRHRPEQRRSSASPPTPSEPPPTPSAPPSLAPPRQPRPHSSYHPADLPHQGPFPDPERSRRKSILGTLRSPLRSRKDSQRSVSASAEPERAGATHRRWTLYRRRKTSEPVAAGALAEHADADAEPDDTPHAESSHSHTVPVPVPVPSAPVDAKGKARDDQLRAEPGDATAQHSPSSSGAGPNPPAAPAPGANAPPASTFSVPTAVPNPPLADASAPAASPPPAPRDPGALNLDLPLPTIPIEPDSALLDAATTTTTTTTTAPVSPEQPAGDAPARRTYPGAGTLVVVQGVVHTSDVAQPSAPPPPDEQPPPVPVRRSASVPPRAGLTAHPPRSRRSSYAAPAAHAADTSASESERSGATSETSLEPLQAEEALLPASPVVPAPASRPLSLSPTSIDVLGTLLSVATAATAASLVSGSSDPLLSSGLGLPGAQLPQPPPDAPADAQAQGPAQSRPLSPTPTAGLASRDRVRNAWAGLRDRLGLRPASPVPPAGAAAQEEQPAPAQADPRAQLLADMARAFHVGMGLDEQAPAQAAAAAPAGDAPAGEPAPESEPERAAPPEDSFERFLMDLQTDLRRTLEEGQGDGDGDGEPEDEDGDDEDGDDDYVEERAAPPAVYPREAAPRAHGPEPELDDDALPALPPDTDDEADDGAEDDPAQAQAQAHEPRRTVAGSERRPGGGINWWRMYRFPPMVVPPGAVPAPASPTAAAATPTAVAAAPEPSPGAEHGAAPAQDGSTVVPVIVVGLQSVHGHAHTHAHDHGPASLQARDEAHAQEADADAEDDEQEHEPEDAERGRRWSAPGARREAQASGAGEAHGSTTFFIYVIGGYYPPNHQLVIGTDPLASFDELAELLGHAKPPTATKEDIEQSGLEVIRAAVLAEYERAGRVAPMCVDRCLICLDEYGAEEDLRLLGCRHVFHKECVDRWLETGRNNCPACRSQGVSTGAGPLSIPSSA